MRKRQIEFNYARVIAWNKVVPSGTPAIYLNDDFKEEIRATCSDAWMLPGGYPLVKVEGISGGVLLDRVIPKGGEAAQFPELLEPDPVERTPDDCPNCSECVGYSHHWIPDSQEDPDLPEYACKHCSARGTECENCNGEGCRVVSFDQGRFQAGELCNHCNREGIILVSADPTPEADDPSPRT